MPSLGEKIAPSFLSELKSAPGKSPDVDLAGRSLGALIVADDKRLIGLASNSLFAEGLRVHPANTIGDALKTARDIDAGLAIVDLTANNFQGLEALRELKKLKSSITIVAITASDSLAEKKAALAAGASAHIPKRPELETLVEEIRAKLRDLRHAI